MAVDQNILVLGASLPIAGLLLYWALAGMSTAKKSFRNGRKQSGLVWVVVLGDFGRSPRMQYHTVSLATQAGKEVHVLAYGGSQPIQAVGDNQAIVLHTIPEPPAVLQRLPRTISMVLKAVLQTVMLLMLMLRRMPRPAAILLQVPPAIPIMALCWLAARWHRAAFVIDWHNFGFTLMRLSMGRRHVLVRLAERFERFWGRRSDGNMCVTLAMQQELRNSWGVNAKVFYDRPPAHFRPASLSERHDLLLRLANVISMPMHPHDCCAGSCAPAQHSTAWLAPLLQAQPYAPSESDRHELHPLESQGRTSAMQTRSQTQKQGGSSVVPGGDGPSVSSQQSDRILPSSGTSSTAQTQQKQGNPPAAAAAAEFSIGTFQLPGQAPQLCPDRPAVLVSSTSWTPDEDFSILLEAAQIYDAAVAQGRGGHPKLLIFVTGKGPQKAMYRARMHQLDLRHVAIRTVWLEPEDYPVLLGSADMGVSLHTSSSGLDLPMKVVDMFGCGLPVCAASYSCISELVAHGQNGMLFTTAQELADHWLHLFQGFPASGELQRLRKHVLASGAIGWSDSWGKVVKPLF